MVAKSAYWLGRTAYFSDDDVVGDALVVADAAGDVQDPDVGLSSTSWNRSRSPVTTSTGWVACVAREPMTSSAS